MSDYKVSVRIDLDQAQKDWDKLAQMSKTYEKQIAKAVKSSREVTKKSAGTKEETQEIRNLTKRTNELIQRMQRMSGARKIEAVDIAKAQREAKGLSRELKKLSTHSSGYTHKLDKLTAATTQFSTHAKRAQEATAGWWKRFGAVAVGFGVAYRAINVLENGIAAYVEILKEGVKAQDDFVQLQGKLAVYSQLYASNAKDFSDGFRLAAVNVNAFQEQLPGAISAVGELTQGVDEFVQHGLAIGPATAKPMVNFLDFTAMVATTTGSTAKQIRQEIQSLFESAMKPGNTAG